jgi:NifU-like protein involved in Fe-S cluster formation
LPSVVRSPRAPLYSTAILDAAVRLAQFPLRPNHGQIGDARSRTCGSTVAIGLNVDQGGRIAALGCRVQACAVGQAAAAVFAEGSLGRSEAELLQTRAELSAWLAGEGAQPAWTGIELLDAARAYPARHGAILLAWDAALAALASQPAVR